MNWRARQTRRKTTRPLLSLLLLVMRLKAREARAAQVRSSDGEAALTP